MKPEEDELRSLPRLQALLMRRRRSVLVAIVGLTALLAAVPAAASAAAGRILFAGEGYFAMNGEGRLLQSFAERVGGDAVFGDWNSDASRLAFAGGRPRFTLMVERVDGSGRRSLTGGTRARQVFAPEFSPAGDQIAFSGMDEDTSLETIYVIPTAGGAPRPLAQNLAYPAWSPDGRRLAATGSGPATPSGPGPYGVWLVHVASGAASFLAAQSRIETDPLDGPAWSPDGDLIAYPTDKALWMVRPDGSGARPVTPALDVRKLAWSPDGQAIAFRTVTSLMGSGTISVVQRDGTRRRVLYRGNFPVLEDWVGGTLRSLMPTRRAVVAQLRTGVGKVRPPGKRQSFGPLLRRAQTRVPYRYQVDAKRGRVRITALGRGRRRQIADFSGGRFKLFRRANRTLIKVSAGTVRVRGSGKRNTVTVRRGQSYVLGAPRR